MPQALEAGERLGAFHGPRIEMETCSLQAQNSLAAGAYADAVSAYARAAELANGDGYPGLAAIFWPTRSVVRFSGAPRPRKWSRR